VRAVELAVDDAVEQYLPDVCLRIVERPLFSLTSRILRFVSVDM
jgi:hypothetical protein